MTAAGALAFTDAIPVSLPVVDAYISLVPIPFFFAAEVAQRLALDEYEHVERRRLAEDARAPDAFEEAARRLEPRKKNKRRDS